LQHVGQTLGIDHHTTISLGQQASPAWIGTHHLWHVAGRLIGQQVDTHTTKLSFINGGQKTLIIAGHQNMITRMMFGQLLEVVSQRPQQGSTTIGIVRLDQANNLIVDHQAIRAIAVPIDATQINVQPGLGQGQGQQTEQTLPVDGLARGTHGAMLCQPNQKPAIDQSHASAAAVVAKSALKSGIVGKNRSLHELPRIFIKNSVAR
jgi:hypothetical protein